MNIDYAEDWPICHADEQMIKHADLVSEESFHVSSYNLNGTEHQFLSTQHQSFMADFMKGA
ncbi:hypothetical protein SAMN05444506_109142 [Pseudomonas syringae]|uniref:Uncharacterized protein n=1 Tax=Pseudomonas syringae pv. apii TaxID=81036 RepID=A0A3M3MGA9_9PSED|nr:MULTISPECIES: hypothetical protein [Pseudomonas syringae group]RMN46329.1 hypothetical protein ALQ58_02713 [Pseudomonas syringae pv. apii]RMN55229.1 hypothetical protein ALQ59_02860 [Pseudomonas syringae pv. apii]RMN94908.1 hypothetical protein ALQ49_03155 [Pseudomonas syringae pv. apii]SDZ07940.1 hypothetical protein SAMN05444506_109142 [Pseudomonas syringae]